MGCNIINTDVDHDVLTAAATFAEQCEKSLLAHDFELFLHQPDSQGRIAYLYGYSPYGKETTAVISRSCYHFEDTFFLADDEENTLNMLVEEFAVAISDNGNTFNFHT